MRRYIGEWRVVGGYVVACDTFPENNKLGGIHQTYRTLLHLNRANERKRREGNERVEHLSNKVLVLIIPQGDTLHLATFKTNRAFIRGAILFILVSYIKTLQAHRVGKLREVVNEEYITLRTIIKS